jgi:hypothetical protein
MTETDDDLVARFTELENTFARTYQQKNLDNLELILAPEYALTISARPIAPVMRAEWLKLIPDYNVRSFSIRDVAVRCLQRSADGKCQLVAVSSINTQDCDVGGQDRSGEFFIVDIWAYREGKWMVSCRYSGRTENILPTLMRH